MQRREFIQLLIALSLSSRVVTAEQLKFEKLDRPMDDWKSIITPEQYEILFRAGTEPSGSSLLNMEKQAGTFCCAACYLPLFSSANKYESGTGWPSFWQPIEPNHIETKIDFKLIYPRTEYHCARCSGHQGHVFKDGPEPTGLRYCNNGLALIFVPENDALPELRG